jgi:hypothetical protein
MDVVRAIEIVYAIGERDLVAGGLADLGERSTDLATLAAIGEFAARHKDARAWYCSLERRSSVGFHSSSSRSPPPESRTIARSGLGLSQGLSMPSPARRAASIRALYQAQKL